MTWYDALGWFGTTLYLLNYAYLAWYKRWKRPVYFSANAVAAVSLVVSSSLLSSWQAVGINSFWAVISIWLLAGRNFAWVRLNRHALSAGVGMLLVASAIALWQDWRLTIAIVGWSSTFAFSLAYLLFAAKRLRLIPYHFWNGYAAFVLLPQLFLDNNWPVFAMEVCWFLISVGAMVKLIGWPDSQRPSESGIDEPPTEPER